MLHAELTQLAAGLPPSILAAAAGRAARLAGISVTDLLEVDAAHEKASIVTATLEKVQAQYAKKKAASRDRRSVARKPAPAVPSVAVASAVASAAQAVSQISIVGAEPSPLPPPPTPSPPPSPPAKAPPRPSRAPAPAPASEESEASEEEEEEEEESEEEPPPPPARALSRAPSRPAAAPKKAAGNATRARWGL